MTRYLYIDIIPEQPVTVKKDPGHENAMGFQQREVIPENIGVGRVELVLQDRTDGVIDGVPNAQQQVSSLPNPWYIVKNFQALKFVVKLINEKEKPARREGAAFKREPLAINLNCVR